MFLKAEELISGQEGRAYAKIDGRNRELMYLKAVEATAVKKKTAVINADIESALSGIHTAKAFANEPVEAEKFTRSNDTYKSSKKQFHKEMGIFMGTMEFFTTSLSVAVVAVGGLLIMQGQMDTVDLLTFTLYIASFVTPIRKLANFSELYANGTAGFDRFLEIMRTAP